MKYLIVIENAGKNFSAYSPDLPGCIATGKSKDEASKNMAEAIQMHLEGLREDHAEIPEPIASADYVEVA